LKQYNEFNKQFIWNTVKIRHA